MIDSYTLLFCIFFPLFLSPIHIFLHPKAPKTSALIFLSYPVVLTVLLTQILLSHPPEPYFQEFPFAPTIGINFRFIIDGLSLFFGILISFMGIMVFTYSMTYLGIDKKRFGFFQTYLVFFLGSMIGCVFSDNSILLFVFWEAVSVISFLLIGFDYDKPNARKGARMALMVTGSTALVMMVGLILLSFQTGTLNISQIELSNVTDTGGYTPLATLSLFFILIGAFGKSALFPFHFWLPNAMAAPTPVSAYLHSATMVKLGIFLTARLFPIFEGNPIWAPLLLYLGFFTMLLGAFLSLLSHELKAILAFATISQLGFFMGVYGLGEEQGVMYDYIHILNHSLYKGALFMLAGVIIKKVGHGDIRKIGYLYKNMRACAIFFLIGLFIMSGLPGTTGFLSKELIFYEIFNLENHKEKFNLILGALVATKIFKVAISTRLFYHLFLRKDPSTLFIKKHRTWPSLIPASILVGISLFFGLFPQTLESFADIFFVTGLHHDVPFPTEKAGGIYAYLTYIVFGGGLLLFLGLELTGWFWLEIPKALRLDKFFEGNLNFILNSSKKVTNFLQPRRPSRMFAWILSAFSIGALITIYPKLYREGFLPHLEDQLAFIEWGALLILLSSLPLFAGVFLLKSRAGQLIAISLIGVYLIFFFVIYQAPDLALTQVISEIFIFLMFLLLLRTPASYYSEVAGNKVWKVFRIALSVLCGLVVFFSVLQTKSIKRIDGIGDFYKEKSESEARGKNVVNTILVDFRGFDTLGEIFVVMVAFSGAYCLIKRRENGIKGI